ncbi:MAG: SIS domain-containing protein [Kiritimatiellaeota bacterium]|nr:SIS domain-containing protein [Kiritimatiellota bacterium]
MDWARIAQDSRAVAEQVLGPLRPEIEAVGGELADRLRAGGKVLFCGNGGSAADAQHFAGEFVNRFLRERRPYAGLALSTDTSVITAIGNDYGYDQIFEKQVRALGRPGDALVAISTSGNAANVCRAAQAARALGLLTIGLTGGAGGRLAALVDRRLSIACAASTPRIQEGHQLVMHLLCERVEELLQ